MVPIHPVVLEKKFVLHISHRVAMLNYKYVKQSSSQKPLDGLDPYLAEMFLARSLSIVVTFCSNRPPFNMAAVIKNRNFFNCPLLL
jgi:hypothetical protein